MKTRTLGRTDLKVSVIGFGGIPIQRCTFEESEAILNLALDEGINFIDTARAYTDSEQKIGKALQGRRQDYIIATKAMAYDAETMTSELEKSLTELGTDMIDLYQVHSVGKQEVLDKILGEGGAVEALERAKKQGKVRYIGITGHSRPALEAAMKTRRFDSVQLPFNPIETTWLEDVIPAARANGAGIIGMKPVAGGALKDVPGALRFSLDTGVDVVIPGMDSIEQVKENAKVGQNLTPPSAEEIARLQEETKFWEGKFCRRCGYCMPCPNGLMIPFLLLIQAYHDRYKLEDWALERLGTLEKKYGDCIDCGKCVKLCPYELPIPHMMAEFEKQIK